jgi:hypothetical protein
MIYTISEVTDKEIIAVNPNGETKHFKLDRSNPAISKLSVGEIVNSILLTGTPISLENVWNWSTNN